MLCRNYPTIHYLYHFSAGKLEAIQVDLGREVIYPALDRSPIYARANTEKNSSLTFTPIGKLDLILN